VAAGGATLRNACKATAGSSAAGSVGDGSATRGSAATGDAGTVPRKPVAAVSAGRIRSEAGASIETASVGGRGTSTSSRGSISSISSTSSSAGEDRSRAEANHRMVGFHMLDRRARWGAAPRRVSRARSSISSIDTSNSLKAGGAFHLRGGSPRGAALPASRCARRRFPRIGLDLVQDVAEVPTLVDRRRLLRFAGLRGRRFLAQKTFDVSSNSLDSKGLKSTPLAPLALKRASSRGTRVPERMRTGTFSVFSLARSSAATAKTVYPWQREVGDHQVGGDLPREADGILPVVDRCDRDVRTERASSNTFRMVRLSSTRRSFFGMVTPDCPSY